MTPDHPDARLIAAAPSLLDACCAAIRRLEAGVGLEDEVRFQLNAAIASALLPGEE